MGEEEGILRLRDRSMKFGGMGQQEIDGEEALRGLITVGTAVEKYKSFI